MSAIEEQKKMAKAAYDKARRLANIDRIKSQQAAYREANREKERARGRAYAAANKDRMRANSRAHYEANREEILARTTERAKANPEARRVSLRLRRARKNRVGGAHTVEDIRDLFAYQKGRCACCRTTIKDGYHVDHITPIARGGDNSKLNLQLLCPPCNLSKGASDPVDFMQRKGFLL